ncbi:unnamed protein product [Vitrella brassicaformis CCMP3155]|uniref:Uncharacterized protein n=1 Tax=Vitrella brassicaformis (strain CCMP3155) TaxID=1169540 RepID=A0A0G4EAU7_VITBC|nr:unnamed protein product [Vitrella brassicaformis CCMP3155]|eukprot:CEL92573.1 unnamed protein product [Vitrella brassicaformis CCMP3155]
MLIPIPSPVVGGVPMQEGGSGLMGGVGHGGGSGEDDITVDASADGSRQPSTAFDIFACAQQQAAQHTTRSIDPSPVAAAAASGDQQPAGPSRPFPPCTPSPITPDQRQGQTSGSDAVAIMSLAADALLAGDIGPFVEQLEELNETPLLPDDGPVVGGLVRSLAEKDKAHRQAGYPFGVEWLPLFGVLVDTVLGRLTLSDREFMAAASVLLSDRIPVTTEALEAFQQHIFCHVDFLVETLVTSCDLAIVWEAYELIGIMFSHARRGFPSELASPAALGKMAAVLSFATAQWPAFIVWVYLKVPVAMAECGYCERVAQAGFLSAAMSILQSDRLIKAGLHGRAVVAASVHLLNLILARNSYASCEGLSEVMCSLLSTVATSDAAYVASIICGGPIGMAIGVLESLSSFCDRQLMSGKAKDNPIVERVLQRGVDLSALSVPLTATSQDSLLQDILDFFAKIRRRKLAIDQWVSSQHDSAREAARRENKQNRLVCCLSDKRVLRTIYQLVGPFHFTAAQVAMLDLSCRSLLDALCPVRSTDRISSYANREVLAPFASILVSRRNGLVAALARYSPDMMLELSIRWECSPTADDISDLIGFLQRADRLMTLQLMFVDLTRLPDDECAQLADAIGRLPSVLELYMHYVNMSPAFADRLSSLLKARPEGDGKGDSSSGSASPPPSSSRDVTRTHSTSSAAVPADSAEDTQETTEARQMADTGDDKKKQAFTTLRRIVVYSCPMSFNSYLNLLEGLCGRSFESLSLLQMVLTKSEGETYRYDELQRVLERVFGTIVCRDIHLSFCSVGELSLPVVEDTVMAAATAGLKTNPNRRTLNRLKLPATAANTTEPFLQLALKDLTLSDLTLRSRVPLGELISQQFLSSGDLASLVHGAVTRAHDERESALRAAREVKERRWAADEARLPPAADAAGEDRRRAAREKREEGLRAEEKEARRKPPFILNLSDVPFANVASPRSPVAVINVIEATNKKYTYNQPVIFTHSNFVPDGRYVGPSSRLPQHLCAVLVRSYDPFAPSTWWTTVASKAPSLLVLYLSSLSCDNNGPDSTFGFQNPFSVTAANLAMYRDCEDELEALKDDPVINNITQEDVDTAHELATAHDLAEAARLVARRDASQALDEKLKRVAVIDKLLPTLHTKLNDLEAQRDKAADADIDSIDNQITSLTEQINKKTAAKTTLLEEIAVLQNAMTDVLNESQGVSGCAKSHQEDPHTSKGRQPTRFESKRDELRHKGDIMQKNAARQAEKDSKRGDQPPKDDAAAQQRLQRAEARARAARKALGVDFSSDEDQQQHGGDGQQGGEAVAAASAAGGSLVPLMTPSMPPLPDIGCDSDDLLSLDGVE